MLPLSLLGSLVACSALPLTATSTPAPAAVMLRLAAQTTDEQRAGAVATELVAAVLTGRRTAAEAFLAPSFHAGQTDLRRSLGLSDAREHGFSLGRTEARRGGVVVDVTVVDRESGVVTLRVEQLDGEWRITGIEPLHPRA